MSQTVTMRLPDEAAKWLKASARRAGRSVSDLRATLVEEARRVSEFAEIEFRTFGGERQACLTGGLRVWKIMFTAQSYEMDAEKTSAHFGLPVWKIRAAFHYYEAFPEEIDAAIGDMRAQNFDTLKRKLPQLERHRVTVERIGEVKALMLAYLLDENISFVVAEQLMRKNHLISAQSIYHWRGGALEGQQDVQVLRAAAEDNLTLVTYDLKTNPLLLSEVAIDGEDHARVVFIDDDTIRGNDFGGLVSALLAHWQRYSGEAWRNSVAFLERAGDVRT